VQVMPLYEHGTERVRLVRLAAGARLPRRADPGGEELFVLEGACADEHGRYPKGTWLRTPPGGAHALASDEGCILYVKTGHLLQAGRCQSQEA
jgi:anti-sigma factor ChrR (cupin superfamily)